MQKIKDVTLTKKWPYINYTIRFSECTFALPSLYIIDNIRAHAVCLPVFTIETALIPSRMVRILRSLGKIEDERVQWAAT